jgi:hypothetical protein
MKKKLLLSLIAISSISMGSAQKLSKNDVSKTKVQTSHLNITKSSSPIKIIDTKSITFVRNDFQLTSSGSKNNAAVTKTKAKDSAVQRNLILNTQDRLSRSLSTSPIVKQQAAIDTTFYESWETYDGAQIDWIPSDWKEENKTGNHDVAGQPNTTWYARAVGSLATQGTDIEWVEADQTGLSRDEWLISPAFTPKATDYLCFDLYYSPYFMYFDMAQFNANGLKQFDFTKPTTTMQVMVSIDGGSNWTKLWDAHDLGGQFNVSNIGNYQNGAWNSFNMPMASYSGKSVKIAFRYVGKGGDGMGVDNIGVRFLKPVASYHCPQGYFYLGLTPNFQSASNSFMLGAPYGDDKWRNQSNSDSKSFSWSFEDPKDDKAIFSSTEFSPMVQYPNGFYNMPTLSATSGGLTNDYKWGGVNSGFFAGGNAALDWGTLGAGNYDLSKGIMNYTFDTGGYVFGTQPNRYVDGICNYFEKPVHKYILDSLWISLGAFKAPVGTVFNLKIRKVNAETGDMSTVMARATCTTADVKEVAPGFFSMLFKDFITYDAVLGLEVTNDYLVIEDGILIEMYGFNKPGITLGAFCERPSNSGNLNAYIFYIDANGKRAFTSSVGYINGRTSLLFNLGITYPFLHADENTFVVPTVGGSKTFNVSSYSLPTDWWMDDALPTWLISSQTYDEVSGAITYTLTAEPLPAGMLGRGAKVIVSSAGADMAFNVSQGEYTGVSNPQATDTKVKIQGDNVELSYTTDFKNLSIYNVTGQNVGSYNLSSVGKMTLKVDNLNRGIYMFKFSGRKNETVKVIR